MPIYQYFGRPAKYHGKPLFHILSNLKNVGQGRIIARSAPQTDKPSFYRVLYAQPLMDEKSLQGRVIAEKVLNGVKYTEPVDLSNIAELPDFILIPKDQEEEFCKWSELREYSKDKDYVVEPKYYTMPPLMRMYMERLYAQRENKISDDSFLLPHYKTYQVKDREELEHGKFVKIQETITRCEGTAEHSYTDKISPDYHHGAGTQDEANQVLDKLPEEMPFPTPFVGMRLYKLPWSNTDKWNQEDPRYPEQQAESS